MPALALPSANRSAPLPDPSRCQLSRPAPGPELCCAPRSTPQSSHPAPPCAGPPALGTRWPSPRAAAARILTCGPRLRQCPLAISRRRLPSCCAAPPTRAATAYAQSLRRARRAAREELPWVRTQAVIRLIVAAFDPSIAAIQENEGAENC